jgi:hypothetical protein
MTDSLAVNEIGVRTDYDYGTVAPLDGSNDGVRWVA